MSRLEDKAENLLRDLLKDVCEKEEIKNYNVEITALPCTGSNYTAALFLATITDDRKKKLELFAKVANLKEDFRKYMPVTEMYRRESFVYQKLTKIYEDIQEKYKIPKEERYTFCKYYAFNDKLLEESVVLENLTAHGYVVCDRFKSMDWDYAEKAVREMAKFHALSFAFERELPPVYEESVKTKNEFVFSTGSASEQESEMYQEGLLKSVFENTYPENLDKLKKFMERYTKDTWKQQFARLRRSVLTHGDYRQSNILIKKEEGKIISLVPVDYQTVFYGCPVNDLLYFIFTGSDQQFRTDHYERLLKHYHNCLGDFLALLSLNVDEIYPEKDFYSDVKDRILFGLYLSMFILPYILVEEKPEFSGKIEEYKVEQSGTFRERFNGILQDYINWDLL